MSRELAQKPAKVVKLSDEFVKNIVHIYKNSRTNQRDLAKSLGISKTTLNRVLKANNAIRKNETPKVFCSGGTNVPKSVDEPVSKQTTNDVVPEMNEFPSNADETNSNNDDDNESIKSFASLRDFEKFVGGTNVPKSVDESGSKQTPSDFVSEVNEFQTYADDFFKYTTWFNSFIKKEKFKFEESQKSATSKIEEEKMLSERLQAELSGKDKMIEELKKENSSLKEQLKKANEPAKKVGQNSQEKDKCANCGIRGKFIVGGMMVCSLNCAKEAKTISK